MKHLPNILTLSNLFFGCVAITFILNAPASFTVINGEEYVPILSLEQIYWGSFFIGLAAIMDVFDGMAARLLNVESAIGRDLDSLADVVSFGVAPAMILFKLLWYAYMAEPGALETSMWVTAPAFLLPCFGALRLARYNQTAQEQRHYFTGMPIPAVGLFFASLPLMVWFPSTLNLSVLLQNRWFLYFLIIVFSYLMVSKIKFLKWKPANNTLKEWWPQILIAVVVLVGFVFVKFTILPIAFILYILLSIITPKKESVSIQI